MRCSHRNKIHSNGSCMFHFTVHNITMRIKVSFSWIKTQCYSNMYNYAMLWPLTQENNNCWKTGLCGYNTAYRIQHGWKKENLSVQGLYIVKNTSLPIHVRPHLLGSSTWVKTRPYNDLYDDFKWWVIFCLFKINFGADFFKPGEKKIWSYCQ